MGNKVLTKVRFGGGLNALCWGLAAYLGVEAAKGIYKLKTMADDQKLIKEAAESFNKMTEELINREGKDVKQEEKTEEAQ